VTELIRPVARQLATLVLVAAAALMTISALDGGQASVFRSDGDLFKRVATDPFGDGRAIAQPEKYGKEYRYGRILFPLVAWTVVAGRPGLVKWSLPVVAVASFWLLTACAAELVLRRGRSEGRALLLLAVPGVWLSAVIAFSETFVLALLLLAFLLETDGRRRAASVVFAATLLAREAVAPALLPFIWRDMRAQGARGLARWVAVGAPLLVWWTWVRVRVGGWPPLDATERGSKGLTIPFAGMVRFAHGHHLDGAQRMVMVMGLLTALLAVVAWRRARWAAVGPAAALLGGLVLCYGTAEWFFPGEAVRIMAYPQAFAALAFAGRAARPAPTVPGSRVP
jgi:hypothetical protein